MSYNFKGDLTDNYDNGDTVIIKFHVIKVQYEEGSFLYAEGETFSEVWNSATNEPKNDPLPASIIRHA